MIELLLLFQKGPSVTPQQQVDLARPGDVVTLVPGFYLELRVDKPLTLIGGMFFHLDLRGPGSGSVTFEGTTVIPISGHYNEILTTGRGFSEVRFHDCYLQQYVVLDGATYVEASHTTFTTAFSNLGGMPTLGARGAAVMLADCTVDVGTGLPVGVQCDTLYRTNVLAPGAALDVVHDFQLEDRLHLSGQGRLGSSLQLSWTGLSGPIVELWASFGSQSPTPAGHGFASLLPDAQLVGLGRRTAVIDYPIPFDFSLYGKEIAFQAYDAPNFYSRPCFAVLH